MKIAIDARIISTSTGRYVERLLEYLQQLDHQNDYVVLLMAEDFQRWQPQAANFSKQVANYPPYTFREQIGLGRQLDALKPDLVHFTMPQQPLLYHGRSVTTIHDLTLINYVNRRQTNPLRDAYKYRLKPMIFRWVMQTVVRRSAALITPTQYVRQQLIDQFDADPQRAYYTYEAADALAADPQAIPALAHTDFILYVGNAYPYKNLERLMEAASGLAHHKLVLAGKPDYFYEQLQKLAYERGYTNVHFAGFVSDTELAWLYQQATLYIFPSLSEGFGLPALEAMSYGLPVAAADASCLPEVCGDAAVYFNPNNTTDISRVIRKTLANPKELARLKAAGFKRVGQFSWKRMAEQTLEVYKTALKSS